MRLTIILLVLCLSYKIASKPVEMPKVPVHQNDLQEVWNRLMEKVKTVRSQVDEDEGLRETFDILSGI